MSMEMENQKFDIYKVGGVLIQDKMLLVARSRGKDFFVAPGGKIEKGENPVEALVRELKEETSVTVLPKDLEAFGTFYAPAIGDESNVVRMDVYLVRSWDGEIQPGEEVEEVRWVTSVPDEGVRIGSIFAHHVIPKLKERGLIQ
jgi:8-oxo-dGTP pyrophosphatase MutT (NUDIX family)